MCIPVVNNSDTLRYIGEAMPQRFKSFSLGNLAEDLNLPSRKLDTSKMEFSMR
jgi:hypothetical protein